MIQSNSTMHVDRKPELLVLKGPSGKTPKSDIFNVTCFTPNISGPYVNALAEVDTHIKTHMGGKEVSLFAVGPYGVLAAGALIRNPSINEVVTYSSRFQNGRPNSSAPIGDKFENEGIAWLTRHSNNSDPLRRRITTVFLNGSIFVGRDESKLNGARRIIVTEEDLRGAEDRPIGIYELPIDHFFTKQAQFTHS